MIVGFGGPHRVVAERRLDPLLLELPNRVASVEAETSAPSMSERLESLLDLAPPDEGDVSERPARSRLTAARRRQALA
jgi:hypothetical protein